MVNMEETSGKAEALTGLEKFLNQVITITAKDGRKIRGKLVEHDEYMNLVLEEAEELSKEGVKHKFMIVKGGNISDISV